MTEQTDAQFGIDGCTCIPWTRQDGAPRYCGPDDTVDQIAGWERGRDCPHHTPSLRERVAAAIASYDHAVGQATDPAPTDHHHGQAAAVLAVRDRELERARAERDEMRVRFDNQAQAGSELIDDRRQLEDRIRAELDDLCREPHPSHDHVCPDDVRRYILRALNPQEQP